MSGGALLAEADGDVAAVWKNEFAYFDGDCLQRVGGEKEVGDFFGEGFDEAALAGEGEFLDLPGDRGVVDGIFNVVAESVETVLRDQGQADLE